MMTNVPHQPSYLMGLKSSEYETGNRNLLRLKCTAVDCKATAQVVELRANTCSLVSHTSATSNYINHEFFEYKLYQEIPELNTPCVNPFHMRNNRSIFSDGLKDVVPKLGAFLIAFNLSDGTNKFYFDNNDDEDDDNDNDDRNNDTANLLLDTSSEEEPGDDHRENDTDYLLAESMEV